MYSLKNTAAFISTKNCNQKYNYHDSILVQLANCIWQMKIQHLLPGFAEMRWFSLGENWNCVLRFRKRQTVGSRWSIQPLSENITGHCTLVSQKGWEEENYLSELFYFSHISSLFINIAFKPYSLPKIWHSSEVINSLCFHVVLLCCSSLKVLQYIPQNKRFLLRQAFGPHPKFLRWRGYCSLCTSASRPALRGSR